MFEDIIDNLDTMIYAGIEDKINNTITFNSEHFFEVINYVRNELKAMDNSEPSEALKCFENMQYRIASNISTIEYNTIKQALLKSQEMENKALAFDYLVKHFNFECKADSLRSGEKWARFVTIQSKDDEGTWDTTAMANLVDYKEEYEFLEQMLKPKN